MTVRQWSIYRGKDGFGVHVTDSRWVGVALEWLLDHDPDWWGEYRNLPFCLINPWGWTWRVGWGDRTVGAGWWAVGQWLYRMAWRLRHEEVVARFPIDDDTARHLAPEFYEEITDEK